DPRAHLAGYGFVTELALAAAAIALGSVVRLVRHTRAQAAHIAALTAAEQARAAASRMQAQRMRIARDLHDTIGHTLSVAALHTSVAAEAHDPEEAAAALERVRSATSEALRELRGTVRVLRDESPDTPVPAAVLGLASLERVVWSARAAGLEVSAEVAVDAAQLPSDVDAVAFRIVQESMTNVLRHSTARHVVIAIGLDETGLGLDIADDGTNLAYDPAGGAGIRGMRERVHLLGGDFAAGADERGFAVRARLPTGSPADGRDGTGARTHRFASPSSTTRNWSEPACGPWPSAMRPSPSSPRPPMAEPVCPMCASCAPMSCSWTSACPSWTASRRRGRS